MARARNPKILSEIVEDLAEATISPCRGEGQAYVHATTEAYLKGDFTASKDGSIKLEINASENIPTEVVAAGAKAGWMRKLMGKGVQTIWIHYTITASTLPPVNASDKKYPRTEGRLYPPSEEVTLPDFGEPQR